jgi:dephospho-CoA kinase
LVKPIIGLTGPTGAGKSAVAAAFHRHGCAVVDADQVARKTAEEPHCLSMLKEAFGKTIIRADGSLDRHALADLAFSSPKNTEKLNSITHPAILSECKKQLSAATCSDSVAVILDAPLLFECGAQKFCNATVAVITPDSSRLGRIMARDGVTEVEAKERMASQHGNEYYLKLADYSFDGSIEWSILDDKASELLKRILRDFYERP